MIKCKDLIINDMKVIDALWFPVKLPGPMAIIGVVCVECVHSGKRKMYIGPAFGAIESQDIQLVVQHGVPFYPNETAGWIIDQMEAGKHDSIQD